MTLIERLLALAETWAAANNRSTATLASRVARDGKFLERLSAGGQCTADKAERFFAFFRTEGNWPAGVPTIVSDLLDGVNLGVAGVMLHSSSDNVDHPLAASGECADISRQAVTA
ncbi:hypothetical protein [Sphingomonas gellani]|uniref:hypothetical protein n=1 Tax=Sphingomonas gellani TaxID=1166340 RepID=UPI0011139D8C|nr:hypothetical protein [Sphingomonas gellani]